MAGGEEEGRKGGVEKDDKECTHGNDSEVMSPAFLNIFNNEYWNQVYEARMGWRKRVRLRLCWRVSLRSGVFWFLSLWKGTKGEGEGEGAFCRYGVMNVCETTIMNLLHLWSLVRPARKPVCRPYPPLMEKLVRIARNKCMRVGVQMRVRLQGIKRVVQRCIV